MQEYNAVQFVEENIKTIFAYSLARVSDKEDAEDLASEIILAILQSKDKIKDPGAFYGFVWGIAANTYKNFLRRKNKLSYGELDENVAAEDDVLENLCTKEELNALRRELTLLSKEYRECTIAYYFDGLSCADTAKRLGISLEMVKYYLFKTRKILKEGIGMEREYGEKSYRPAKFELVTIFSGSYNAEYRNLFNRKLPGNIMLSAYYTPMTIRELSLELGVASPYLEDEIGLLEKYELIKPLGGGKYQTNLVIFTEAFTKEFYKNAAEDCKERLNHTLNGIKQKLAKIRNVGFIGCDLEDNSLLWAFLWLCMRNGYSGFENMNPGYTLKDKLYNGATGINYGVDYDCLPELEKYSSLAFAGYAGIDDDYAMSFADFGVLPKKNRYPGKTSCMQKLYAALEDRTKAEFAVMRAEELKAVENIISEEIKEMADFYVYLTETAVKTMRSHAPDHVCNQIDHIVGSTIFFRTVGFIGGCAADSGAIFVPEDDNAVALYAYRTKYSEEKCGDVC